MASLLKHPATVVWLILAAVTVFSWWLGVGQAPVNDGPVGGSAGPQGLVTTGLILLSLFKVRLILFHFMEVRTAPRELKWVCDAWVVLVTLLLIGIYWLATPGL